MEEIIADLHEVNNIRNLPNLSNRGLLHLQGSDHLGLILLSSPLTGANYRYWSRAMKIALGTKNKLGFIDGRVQPPDEESKIV